MRARRRQPASRGTDAGVDAIDSLQRGLELLRGFRPGDDTLSIGEAAARCGLSRGTTERLLSTLAAHGFLQQMPDGERFRPDVGCLLLGRSLLGSLGALRTARPILQALADAWGVHALLAVPERGEMLCLLHCAGSGARPLTIGTGSLLPVTSTAAGRAWLWGSGPAEQGAFIARLRAQADDGSRPVAALYRAFQELEEQGLCHSLGDWQRDVSAVATPLLIGTPAMVLSCKVAGLDHDRVRLTQSIGPALLEAAANLKDALLRAGDLGPARAGPPRR